MQNMYYIKLKPLNDFFPEISPTSTFPDNSDVQPSTSGVVIRSGLKRKLGVPFVYSKNLLT